MEILKIVEALQSYSEDVLAYKLDGNFACAVTEAVELLVRQGEKIADMEKNPEIKTNGDRFRGMSDREIAEFLAKYSVSAVNLRLMGVDDHLNKTQLSAMRERMTICWMTWLQQPVGVQEM